MLRILPLKTSNPQLFGITRKKESCKSKKIAQIYNPGLLIDLQKTDPRFSVERIEVLKKLCQISYQKEYIQKHIDLSKQAIKSCKLKTQIQTQNLQEFKDICDHILN